MIDIVESVVRIFVDDTRVNNQISNEIYVKEMKEDWKKHIYRWADENRMAFNEGKFEQIVHGKTIYVDIESYENPKGENIEIRGEVKHHGIRVVKHLKCQKS